MKNIIPTILILTPFMFISCNSNNQTQLTDEGRVRIKSEVLSVLDQIMKSTEVGNFEKAIEHYANDPQFISVNISGEISDYNSFLESNKGFFDVLDHQTFDKKDTKFTFIDSETVILTYSASALATLKDNQQLKVDPFASTLVFRRIDDSWKVTYTHESGIFTPVVGDSTSTE